MTDKKERQIGDIQMDYQSNCTKAGHLQYQIKTLSDDLGMVNGLLRELNLEAAALQAKAVESTPAPETAPAEAAPAPVSEASNG